jgi:hypothetical protein
MAGDTDDAFFNEHIDNVTRPCVLSLVCHLCFSFLVYGWSI